MVSWRLALVNVCISGASLAAGQAPSAPPDPAQPRQKVASAAALRARTADERARAGLFNSDGFPILEAGLVTTGHRDADRLPTAYPPDPPGTSPIEHPTVQEAALELKDRVCSADAILIGHAQSRRALLNRDETFLFTDFTVIVERWIRPATAARTVLVSQYGGEVELKGRLISADAGPRLVLSRPYFFLLKRITPGDSTFVQTEDPIALDTSSAVQRAADAQLIERMLAVVPSCGGRR